MEENDDKLIRNFLQAGKKDIADGGFSRRVMKQLPATESWIGKCWTWGCFALTTILFVALNGFELLYDALRQSFITLIQQETLLQVDSRSLYIAGAVILCLIYKKIASMA